MTSALLRTTAAFALVAALAISPAGAQRQQATPEQRIDRLENQLRQVQKRVFPKGQPADTAGLADEPAATQASVRSLDDRIGALERQLADVLRAAEENGHQLRDMQAELTRLRTDQEQRLQALEAAARAAPVAAPVVTSPAPAADRPAPVAVQPAPAPSNASPAPVSATPDAAPAPVGDAAEAAYNDGFRLWQDGKYDAAIASLRATASSFPKSKWVSWANNLAGRALLDKGEPRAAAEALLANYRSNPKGERAADSLFYLGQSLKTLGQPQQACKAYGELEAVYGGSLRGELQRLLPGAKRDAGCN
jgi:TolA-binding protein